MDLKAPHDHRLEDDEELICTNFDLYLPKTDPQDVLHIPFDLEFDFPIGDKNLSSEPDNNQSCGPPRLHKFTSEQDIRKENLRRYSSYLVSTDIFLALFYNISSSLLPHQKQPSHRLSMWMSLLGLFGFLVFVCALAVMILLGGVFTSMQKAMLIIWLVLMHLQSANSILEICVILLAGFFMAWYAFWKKESPNNDSDIKSSNMLTSCQLKQ